MSASGEEARAAGRRTVLAVTSGSGGVGKTFLVSNLAAALVHRGERVVVLDADLGLANLDTMLDLRGAGTLHDVFVGAAALDDAVVRAPGGFDVCSPGRGCSSRRTAFPTCGDSSPRRSTASRRATTASWSTPGRACRKSCSTPSRSPAR